MPSPISTEAWTRATHNPNTTLILREYKNKFYNPKTDLIIGRESLGWSNNDNHNTLSDIDIAFMINYEITVNNKKIVYFSDISETYEHHFLNTVNRIVLLLLNIYDIDLKILRFISGAAPIKNNYLKYQKLCIKNNWIKLSLLLFNNYEFRMKNYLTQIEKPLNFENTVKVKSKVITCFNGKARPHRLWFLADITKRNILHKFYFSMHQDNLHDADLYAPLIPNFLHILQDFKNSGVKLPLIATLKHKDKNWHSITDNDLEIFKDSYLSVIPETSFFKHETNKVNRLNTHLDSIFITEKTFRTIAGKHPFIILSRPHTLKALREMGYQTFSPYINESYDDIQDDVARMKAILDLVNGLCNAGEEYWKFFSEGVKDIVEHNYNKLLSAKVYCIDNTTTK